MTELRKFFENYRQKLKKSKGQNVTFKEIGKIIGYSDAAFSRILRNKNPFTESFVKKVLNAYESNKLLFTIDEVHQFQAFSSREITIQNMKKEDIFDKKTFSKEETSIPINMPKIQLSPIKVRIMGIINQFEDDEDLIMVETTLKEMLEEYKTRKEELKQNNN